MPDPAAPRRALRVPEVCSRVGKCKSWLYDIVNPKSSRFDPSFPPLIRIGGNTVVMEHALDSWLDGQAVRAEVGRADRVAKARRAAAASVASRAAKRTATAQVEPAGPAASVRSGRNRGDAA